MTRAYARHHECPTCEYWDGERKPDKNPQYAQYNGYGTCLSPNSNYRGQKVGFSFSVIFSFLAIFKVLLCAFIIFHVF